MCLAGVEFSHKYDCIPHGKFLQSKVQLLFTKYSLNETTKRCWSESRAA